MQVLLETALIIASGIFVPGNKIDENLVLISGEEKLD